MGGLHRFMQWDGPILTDSGGFQVFSLEGLRTIDEDGVEFRSHFDGSLHQFTPESVMRIERNLGADVIMQFDHVVPGQSDEAAAREAMERSMRWLERCRTEFERLRARGPRRARRRRRRSSPSCRAGFTPDCAGESARAIRAWTTGSASASAGCRWARPSRTCTPCSRSSTRSCPPTVRDT